MKTIFTLCLFIIAALTLQAQTVTTIPTFATGIDDDIKIGPNGALYASAFDSGKIFMVLPDTIILLTDSVPYTNALDFDSQGNLFSAGQFSHNVYKITPNGTVTILTDSIKRPSGLAKMPNSDTLIVASATRRRLYKVAPDGTVFEYIVDTRINNPIGLRYDDNGTLFAANFNNPNIYKVMPADTLELLCTLPGNNIGFITFGNGKLYASLYDKHKIYEIDPVTGSYTVFAGDTAATIDGDLSVAQFNGPNGLFFTPSGDTLYVTEYNTKSLRMITGLNPDTSTAAIQILTQQISVNISPNPSSSIIQVNTNGFIGHTLTVHLYNMAGQQIGNEFTASLISESTSFSIELPQQAGNYILELSSGKQRYTTTVTVK